MFKLLMSLYGWMLLTKFCWPKNQAQIQATAAVTNMRVAHFGSSGLSSLLQALRAATPSKTTRTRTAKLSTLLMDAAEKDRKEYTAAKTATGTSKLATILTRFVARLPLTGGFSGPTAP